MLPTQVGKLIIHTFTMYTQKCIMNRKKIVTNETIHFLITEQFNEKMRIVLTFIGLLLTFVQVSEK